MRFQCQKKSVNGYLKSSIYGCLSGFMETIAKRADFGLKAKNGTLVIAASLL